MLMGLAYRILGSLAEAEDVVQEVFLAWAAADRGVIDRPRHWLTTVCTRKAIDVLRSARLSRTDYVGPWLPEPLQTDFVATPESDAALSQSVTTAFLLVLDRLAPKERAAFLLHDVFDMSYAEVADSLEIGEAACRKLVSRARVNLRRERNLSAVPRARQDELVAAFQAAIETGDTDRLASLLSQDATLSADSGGKVIGILKSLVGAEAVLDFVGRVLSPAWSVGTLSAVQVNAGCALVLRDAGRPVAVVSFAYNDDGKASGIYIMRNPDKLARIA